MTILAFYFVILFLERPPSMFFFVFPASIEKSQEVVEHILVFIVVRPYRNSCPVAFAFHSFNKKWVNLIELDDIDFVSKLSQFQNGLRKRSTYEMNKLFKLHVHVKIAV